MARLLCYSIFIVLILQIVPTHQTERHGFDPELLYMSKEESNNGPKLIEPELLGSFVFKARTKRETRESDISSSQIMKNNTNSPTTIQSSTNLSNDQLTKKVTNLTPMLTKQLMNNLTMQTINNITTMVSIAFLYLHFEFSLCFICHC